MRVFINNIQYTEILQGSISISNRANGERSLSLSAYDVVQGTFKEGNEVEVFAGSGGSTKLFGGIINGYSAKFLSPITDEYPLIQIDVQSDGYNVIPQRRVVNISYTNTNIRTIVLAMLSSTNLGAETITAGTITASTSLPSITYEAKYKTIAEVLDELAAACGHVWYIDNSRRLQFVKPQGITNSPYELNTFNGTFTDFSDLSWSGGIENYCNTVFVIGDFADSPRIEEVPSEIASRSSEADGQGTGIYERVIEDSNIKSLFQAGLVADTALQTNAISPSKLSFSTYTEGFAPNQKLNVRIQQITGFDPIPPNLPQIWTYLIDEVSIDRENAQVTKYSISATRRNSSNFSTQKSSDYKEYFKNILKG